MALLPMLSKMRDPTAEQLAALASMVETTCFEDDAAVVPQNPAGAERISAVCASPVLAAVLGASKRIEQTLAEELFAGINAKIASSAADEKKLTVLQNSLAAVKKIQKVALVGARRVPSPSLRSAHSASFTAGQSAAKQQSPKQQSPKQQFPKAAVAAGATTAAAMRSPLRRADETDSDSGRNYMVVAMLLIVAVLAGWTIYLVLSDTLVLTLEKYGLPTGFFSKKM